jgi:hypothetical protein
MMTMSLKGWTMVLVSLVALGGCKPRTDKASAATATPGATATAAPAAAAPAPAPAMSVEPKTILADYKDNEVRADGLYKGKQVRITGTVGEVKKDIMGSMYVTVGTGKAFELPIVQCMLEDDQVAKASALKKGGKVTIEGEVTGLMMNVLVRPCSIQ